MEQAQAQLGLAEINVKRDTPLAAARAIAQSQLDSEIQARRRPRPCSNRRGRGQDGPGHGGAGGAQPRVHQSHSLVSGIAGIATIQIGNLVSPTTTVLTTVSQVDPIKVYFPISEQEYLAMANRHRTSGTSDMLRQSSRCRCS